MKKYLGQAFILIAIAFIASGVFAQTSNLAQRLSPVSISDAFVYVPVGKADTTQAFFTLQNNSQQQVVITRVTSSAAKKIALISTGGNVLNVWSVAPGQRLTLMPGRQYLQLEGIKSSIVTGDELHFDVSLSNGKTLTVIAKAKSAFDQIHGR